MDHSALHFGQASLRFQESDVDVTVFVLVLFKGRWAFML